jgi:hypothetical protein
MRRFLFVLGSLVLALTGCGQAEYRSPAIGHAGATSGSYPGGAESAVEGIDVSGQMHAAMGGMMGQMGAKPTAPPAPPSQPANPMPRKIIRTADVHLVVQDFDQAEQELRQILAQQPGAYIAQAETSGSAGAPRSGRWKIRLPADSLDAFLAAVVKLGYPERNSVDSKDVTEEFYDLEARTKIKKAEEERLLRHLDKSTAKLEDILQIERELTRVRGEIEQQEGRLRLLANLTTLTTVTLTMREDKKYVPPQTPSFTATIASTFDSSLDLLVQFGKGAVLVAVAVAPWLPLLAIVAAVLVWPARRAVRNARPPAQAEPGTPA